MKYVLIIYSVVITAMFALYIDTAEDLNSKLEYDLNVSNTAIMVYKAENKRLREENVGLRKANQCLLDYAEKDRCITAIKHSPLPKLVEETK